MEHQDLSARAAFRPNPDWFTGDVSMRPVAGAPEYSSLRCMEVRFSPGARTNWHTHPAGQTLYVLSGEGRACLEGGEIVTLRPGDTVQFPPHVRHWHGAAPGSEMVHLAMQQEVDGEFTLWEEAVSDTDYGA